MSVDWSSLSCGAGPATRVPELLTRVADENARRRGAARRDLAQLFRTRGGLPWDAAPFVVEHLLGLLAADDEDRAARIRVIADVAFGDCDEYAAFGFDPRHANLPWLLQSDQPLSAAERAQIDAHRRTRLLLTSRRELWIDALQDADAAVRTNAAFVMALLPELQAVDTLLAAVPREDNEHTAATMTFALGLLRAPEAPRTSCGGDVVELVTIMGATLGLGLTDAREAELERLLDEHEPSDQVRGWPWLDGRLRQHAEEVLLQGSLERGDCNGHNALQRHQRLVQTGAALQLLITMGRGRRQHRRLAAHEVRDEDVSALEVAVAAGAPKHLIERAGFFPKESDRAMQLDAAHCLAQRPAGEPLWRLLSDVVDGIRAVSDWYKALADLSSPLEVVFAAAHGWFRLYRRGARHGISEGDARWEQLNDVLRATLDHLRVHDDVPAAAAQYRIDEGLNLGLFLLETAQTWGVEPTTPWVAHVAAEVNKKWAQGPRIERLKAWAAGS